MGHQKLGLSGFHRAEHARHELHMSRDVVAAQRLYESLGLAPLAPVSFNLVLVLKSLGLGEVFFRA